MADPARPTPVALWRDARRIFLVLWFAYGASVNNLNLQIYTLHPDVVLSLVHEGTFVIGHEDVPQHSDRFLIEGNQLPAKQPLIFALGAIAYAPLQWLGITYANQYFLAGALVTWMTASLLAAAAGACAYLLAAGHWGFGRGRALLCAVAGSGATVILPYAGIPHHDVTAAALFMMALLALEIARSASGSRSAWLAGVLLGLTLTTSMLPSVMVAGLLAAIVATRRIALILPVGGGFLVGVMPLALYNLHYFHQPILQANVAGGFEDTYPTFSPARMLDHLNVFLGTGKLSAAKYMPIFLVGLAGLVIGSIRRRSPARLLLGLVALHLLFIVSIETVGHCQYGPRYLIPVAPLVLFGLGPLLEECRRWTPLRSRAVIAIVAATTIYSFAVNFMGVLGGTMYCDIERFAFPRYLEAMSSPAAWSALRQQFTLALPCLLGLAIVAAWSLRGAGKARPA